MIDIRPFDTHLHTKLAWLDAYHHFNFAGHRHAGRDGWGALRVWNDDTIDPHTGFDMHPHRDMEIITYVRDGAISHRDHLGNHGRTEAGDVQVMSAGSGILHEERNRETTPTRIFQIWMTPSEAGGTPYWNQARFPKGAQSGALVALASGRGHADALPIRADATVYGATLKAGETITHPLAAGRYAYLVPAVGDVEVNGVAVAARAGAAIKDVPALTITATGTPTGGGTGGDTAEVLLVDIPA